MVNSLKLATKYAGFASIEQEILSGLSNLEITRDALVSTQNHMKTDSTEALEALSLVKHYLHEQRDAVRSEIQKIRGVLSGDLEACDD